MKYHTHCWKRAAMVYTYITILLCSEGYIVNLQLQNSHGHTFNSTQTKVVFIQQCKTDPFCQSHHGNLCFRDIYSHICPIRTIKQCAVVITSQQVGSLFHRGIFSHMSAAHVSSPHQHSCCSTQNINSNTMPVIALE